MITNHEKLRGRLQNITGKIIMYPRKRKNMVFK